MKSSINQYSLMRAVDTLTNQFQQAVYHHPKLGRLAGWTFAATMTGSMNLGAMVGIIENIALFCFNLISLAFNKQTRKDLNYTARNLLDFSLIVLTSPVFFIKTTQAFWRQQNKEQELREREGWNPIHFAASYNDIKELKKILELDPKQVNLATYGDSQRENKVIGETPLHIATRKRNIDSVAFIIEHLKEVNNLQELDCVNLDNKTALMIATENNQVEIMRLLLNNGADHTKTDSLQNTALTYAIEMNLEGPIKMLEQAVLRKKSFNQ